jgi:UDP-N-acetylmuramoyl-tripeptide--D-alanyl-D-alanine ligase
MKPLTIHQIRQAVGGRALTALPPIGPSITAVCTDTRRMEKGSLFVALKGDNFNAHEFLPQAAAGGAIAALVEEAPPETLPNVHLIQVPNAREALGKLARYVRQQISARVISVGGSNGKTSTKNLIDAALSGKLKGSISPKSFNNDIGVPLTIFPADPSQDYIVLELGTNHHGEMRLLTQIALPDIAVITCCAPEHLEGLDDLRGVRQEEASIIQGLDPKGLLVVNGDDPELLEAVSAFPGRRITFGFKPDNDLFATHIECDEHGVHFRLNNRRRTVFVPMLGRHTACNALAAIAVARRMGVPEDAVIEGLAQVHGPEMRLQFQTAGKVKLLNDCYNANPGSMHAALDTLRSLATRGRRVAILGDMRELGRSSERFHREIGQFAAECELDLLMCVGEQAALIAESAQQAGMAANTIKRYADADAASRSVPRLLRTADLVLIKASRGIHLEIVAGALSQPQTAFFRKVAS